MLRGFACLLLAALPAPSEWLVFKTPQLELITDAGEKSAARLLDRMATVRQVLGQGPSAERPLRVFLFSSESEFRPFADGSATQGFFQSGPERDYIVLHAGSGFTRNVAHEYVHRILNRTAPRFPKWLDEGLAEFYSNLEVSGHTATVGLPIDTHIATLATARWLSAQELESAAGGKFDEKELAGIFYSESWLLVNALKLSPQWRDRTPRFLDELTAGKNANLAFQDSFGITMDEALKSLHLYVRQIRPARIESAPKMVEEAPAAAKSDAETASLYRADLALHARKLVLARRLFEEAAKTHPDSPEAESGLGALAMAENRPMDAREHLFRATELKAPGGEKYFELAMLRREEDAPAQEVDQLLERAVAADPLYAEAHLLLGQRQTDRGEYASAIKHLEIAANTLPRQSYIWHALAYAESKAGQKEAARDSAHRALQTARSTDHEQMARALLESLE